MALVKTDVSEESIASIYNLKPKRLSFGQIVTFAARLNYVNIVQVAAQEDSRKASKCARAVHKIAV
jgi:hypothetical protein